jgi:glucokinase
MGRFTTTHDLVSACKAGDSVAREIWLKSVRALACGVTSFINVLDPEIVILGGGIARTGELLFKALAEHLDSIEWRPGGHRAQIVPAKMGEYAGAFGAAYNALRRSD